MVEIQQYYTVPEVAKMLKVSKSYIYDLVNHNHLESVKLSTRRTRISKIALDEFIKKELDKPIANNVLVQPPIWGRKH